MINAQTLSTSPSYPSFRYAMEKTGGGERKGQAKAREEKRKGLAVKAPPSLLVSPLISLPFMFPLILLFCKSGGS